MQDNHYSNNALAQLSGFDRRTLTRIINKSYPDHKGGEITLKQFCHAVRSYYTNNVESERERRARIQADLAQLELDERRESLVRADEMTALLQDMIVKIRVGLGDLCKHVAHEWEPTPARTGALESFLDSHVRRLLIQAADSEIFFSDKFGKQLPGPICEACKTIRSKIENEKTTNQREAIEHEHAPALPLDDPDGSAEL